MTKELQSYEHIPWQIIKGHLQNPESVVLSEEHRKMLDRIFSMQRVLQRWPQPRTALAIHRSKFPEISRRTAYNDMQYARELENTYHTFDYDFWNNWLIQDVIDQIQAAKAKGDMKAWAAGHANLKKAIGERPMEEMDPKLLEKHTFIINVKGMKDGVQINIDNLDQLSTLQRKEIADAVWEEIDENQAKQILES
jgi:hypothetical protein